MKLAGEYTTVAKFRMKPGDEAMESKGTAKLASVLGGRFLQEENTGMQLNQPISGMRLYGFNAGSGQYEGMWVYTASTGIMTLTGSSSDGGKTIKWAASFDVAKGQKMNLEVVTKVVDDDHFVVELIARGPDGKPGPTLETTYTRKK
jgi:hypothetical protein